MNIFRSRTASALAMAAALSLTATPALARGYHRHHDRGGVDAGDIFAGLLVIGGIAAIASAASKKKDESREADYHYPGGEDRTSDDTYRDTRPEYPGDRDSRQDYGYSAGNLDGVVDRCVSEIERGDRRVESVDSVNRVGEGWRVEGQASGRTFACSVDRDGNIRGLS